MRFGRQSEYNKCISLLYNVKLGIIIVTVGVHGHIGVELLMKVTIKRWHGVAIWKWEIDEDVSVYDFNFCTLSF